MFQEIQSIKDYLLSGDEDNIILAIELFKNYPEYFKEIEQVVKSENISDIDEKNLIKVQEFLEIDEKIMALAIHLNLPFSEIEAIKNEYENYYSYFKEEYIVADEDEADELEKEYVENLIEECYLWEIKKKFPDLLRYFNIEEMLEDFCGNRGENLSSYDGREYDVTINNKTYNIYRIN